MQYFRVVNWDRFQHYGKRSPPWIKFYNSALEDPAIGTLPDEQKAHLFGIWLLASRLENKLPLDEAFIAKRINASKPVHLKVFMDLGLLEPVAEGLHDASTTLATCTLDQSRPDPEQSRADQSRTVAPTEPKPANNGHRPTGFRKPTLQEIQEFIEEKKLAVDAVKFYAHYESNGWRVGKNPMQKWKMAVWTWARS